MSAKDGSDKYKRMMSLEMKHEIIDKHEHDVRGVYMTSSTNGVRLQCAQF